MSIYVTRAILGEDFAGEGVGKVVGYPRNDLSRINGNHWPKGSIDTAHIPHYCIPGHSDEDDCVKDLGDTPVAGWLRLAIEGPGMYATALIDAKAAEELRDDLTEWLEQPKAKIRKVKR